ncbi:MAG: hypothetical protein AB4042_01925 [Leptolyngbyaceae cyanobacterium]
MGTAFSVGSDPAPLGIVQFAAGRRAIALVINSVVSPTIELAQELFETDGVHRGGGSAPF